MSAAAESIVLSVVIPTHNVHPWIRETLGSVLSQVISGRQVGATVRALGEYNGE